MSKLASSSIQNISAEELHKYFRHLKNKELSNIEKVRFWLAFFEAPPPDFIWMNLMRLMWRKQGKNLLNTRG
jgi:hypothetical protein